MTAFSEAEAGPAPLPVPALRAALLAWFDRAGRDLPWRRGPEGGRDPYRAWVAEVLLQQTQVARGLGYYDRFLTAFPTVQALAAAPIDDVLKAWEGCGYYARARNLHRAAGVVAAQGFPTTYAGWLALPGVGPYTAAALSSFTLNAPCAVNDGNVRRVLARLRAQAVPTPVWVQAQADTLLDPARPGAWNEAVMDLGATVCIPKAPRCAQCPVSAWCAARATGQPAAYPAPKVRAAVQEVQAAALLVGDAAHAYLERREGALLGGLMGLPTEALRPGEAVASALARLCDRLGAQPGLLLGQVRHGMTHRQVTLHVYAAQAELPRQDTGRAALSRLDQKALALVGSRQAGLFPVE
ncbi:A/G-specific adenine glycosylase [Deinococcus sp. HMF7604]|uniref:A/G-specific adenine glycosylase n=1 Tax=Deinococcus betulae TaxID=2873312 RepID=UPI001CCB9F8A|nr:A/G-specific adenine glycosylase [Deinococcus betulae]